MKKLSRHLRQTARHFGSLWAAPRRSQKQRRMLTSEILEARQMLAGDILNAALHNAAEPTDVNGDGRVTRMDLALLVGELQKQYQSTKLPGESPENAPQAASIGTMSAPSLFYDVNADNKVNRVDVALVVQRLVADFNAMNTTSDVKFRVETTNLANNPISEIKAGEEFWLKVYVQDTRGEATGLRSAHLDVTFNQSLVKPVNNTIQHGSDYNGLTSGDVLHGRIDDAGGMNVNPQQFLGGAEYLLFQVRFVADRGGTVTFAGAHHDSDESALLFFDDPSFEISEDLVNYGSATLTVLGAVDDEIVVSKDAGPTAVDVLANDTLPGDLKVVGVVPGSAPGTVTFDDDFVYYDPAGAFDLLEPGQTEEVTFTYIISDGTNTSTATVTVTVSGDSAPVITPGTFTVNEHAANGTAVGTVEATPAEDVTFAIIGGNTVNVAGNPVEVFAIDNSGNITVASELALDFEARDSYQLTVQATNSLGLSSTQAITIDVNDLKLVEFFVEVYDSEGNQITETDTLPEGSTFELRVYVQDLRPQGAGIFVAYLDVEYTSELVSLLNAAAPLTFGSDFHGLYSGSGNTPGLIDEAGASRIAVDGVTGKALLFSAEFTADAVGTVSFTTNQADNQNGIGVGIVGAPVPLTDVVDVIYGSTSFEIVSSAVFEAKNDSYDVIAGENFSADAEAGVLANDSLGPAGGTKAVQAPGPVTTAHGATVMLNADGSFTFNTAGVEVFQELGADETLQDTFTYTLTDGLGNTETATVTITVTGVNDPPQATDIVDQTISQGGTFSLDVKNNFSDVDVNDTLTLSATLKDGSALPAWLNFNPSTGEFTGTPGNDDVGVIEITVTATDNHQAQVSRTFTLEVINVNDAPTIENQTFRIKPGSETGTEVNTVVASDIDIQHGDVLTYEIIAGNDDGLFTINPATGLITFTGNAEELVEDDVHTLTVRVTDVEEEEATAQVTIIVTPNSPPEAVTPILDPQEATQDDAFSFTFSDDTFTDVDGDPLTYSAQLEGGAALPSWLSFDPTTRTFSGTPANADVGQIVVEIIATDTDGAAASATFAMTIHNVNDAPVLDEPIPQQVAIEDVDFTFDASEYFLDIDLDVDPNEKLTYSAALSNGDPLPSWLSLDPDSGTFTGMPGNDDVDNLVIRVTATDTSGESISTTFELKVENVNDPPTSTPIDNQSVDQGEEFTLDLKEHFHDIDLGDVLTYEFLVNGSSSLPDWLTFNDETGILSGTPGNSDVGTLTIRITATDEENESVSEEFELEVINVNDAPELLPPIGDQETDEDEPYSYNAGAHFIDIDAGDTLTYSAKLSNGDDLPEWLSINPEDGILSGTPENDDVGILSITVTATDSEGATVSGTFLLEVKNVNDAPTAEIGTAQTSKGISINGNVLTWVTDVDVDDTLTVTTTGEFTTSQGAKVTLNADGTFTYDPRSSDILQALTSGESLVDSFNYTVRDEAGETVEGTVNVTVSGLNPSTISGMVYIDVNGDGSRQLGEQMLAGVKITLTGNGITRETVTNANGAYTFIDLAPGTYTVTQHQPAFLSSAGVRLGASGGQVLNSNSFQITIAENQSVNATGYNFREAGLETQYIDLRYLLSNAPTSGVMFAVNGNASLWSSAIGSQWSGYTSITATLSADHSQVLITAFNAEGDEYQATISTGDATKFMWVGNNGGSRLFQIIGSVSDIGLTLVPSSAPEAAPMMASSSDESSLAEILDQADEDYTAAVDALFADEDWSDI